MSASLLLDGIPQPPVSVDLTTANRTDVIENNTAYMFSVVGLTVSNDQSTDATLRLELTNDDASWSHVWFANIVAETPQDVPVPIFIFPGWTLVATAEAGDRLLIHANYLMGRESIGS